MRIPALVSPAVPSAAVAVRAHDQAMPSSSGAMSALRMSLTTVATSSAPGEYAALAATTWLVSLMAMPVHSPNAASLSPRACPTIG